jgi:hypothetical protein
MQPATTLLMCTFPVLTAQSLGMLACSSYVGAGLVPQVEANLLSWKPSGPRYASMAVASGCSAEMKGSPLRAQTCTGEVGRHSKGP